MTESIYSKAVELMNEARVVKEEVVDTEQDRLIGVSILLREIAGADQPVDEKIDHLLSD